MIGVYKWWAALVFNYRVCCCPDVVLTRFVYVPYLCIFLHFFLLERQLLEKKSLCVSHTLWIKLILIWYAGCLCAQFHKWEAHGDSALEQLLPDGPLLSLSLPLLLRPPQSTTESSRRWAWLTLRANTWSSSSIPWICKYFWLKYFLQHYKPFMLISNEDKKRTL